LLSRVEFEVVSGFYCNFFNWIIENEINISNIRCTDFGFTAVCNAGDYKKLARTAKKYQCRTKLLKRKGIYFSLRKVLDRKGIFVGMILVFVYIFVFSHMIWRIDVIAPTKNITDDVYSLLYANDCYCGAWFSQDKNQKLIQQIFMNVDNIGYVTLNFYKGILTCKVDATINKMPYLKDRTSGNIYATADGVIEEMEIYNGFTDVETGQTVQKGDILVSATYIDRNGTLQQVMPRAYIKAYCIKEYTAEVLFNKDIVIRTGEYTDRVLYKFCGKDFVIKKENTENYEYYDKEKFFEHVNLFGFRLPLTKETVRFYKTETVAVKNDRADAENAAKRIVDLLVKSDLSFISADSCEYYSNFTRQGVTVLCKVYGHYNITR